METILNLAEKVKEQMQGVYKVHENYIFTNEGHLVMVGAMKENS